MADAKASDPSRTEPAPQAEAAPSPARAAAKRGSDPDLERLLREAWSRRMLPWMLRMLVGLTVFFFVASAAQLAYLHYEITTAPKTDLSRPLAMMGGGSEAGTGEVGPGGLPAAAVAALSVLELGAIEHRYHQANVSLLSRVWTRYLGFVTGMVLAMVGAAFILGRLETTMTTTVKARIPGGPLDLKSTSPGLVLAGLGVALMITTIVTHHEIAVQDQPIYARGWSFGSPATDGGRRTDSNGILELQQREPETGGAGGAGVAPSSDLEDILRGLSNSGGSDAPTGNVSSPRPRP